MCPDLVFWRRGAIIGAIVVVLIALGVSAAPNLPSISRSPCGSEGVHACQ